MKTPRIVLTCALILALGAAPAFADQNLAGNVTITGGATGNLFVTGYIDSDNNQLTFGTQSTSYGVRLLYADNSVPAGASDTLQFLVNRSPGSWLWLKNTGTVVSPTYTNVMRLDGNNQLILFRSDGTTAGLTLTPQTSVIKLGTHASATLTGNDSTGLITAAGALTVSGAFTASTGITNTNGSLTGGASGLALSAGGTNQNITLTPSGTGNVGIGTTSPSYTLDVQSTNGTGQGRFKKLSGGSDNYVRVDLANGVSTNYWQIAANPNNTAASSILNFYHPGSANVMTLLGNGNVGIGTTVPGTKLDVQGDGSDSQDTFRVTRGAGNAARLQFGHNYIQRINGDSSYGNILLNLNGGNVGVGTTNPTSKLQVENTGAGDNNFITLNQQNGYLAGGRNFIRFTQGTTPAQNARLGFDYDSYGLQFRNSADSATVTIKDNGNVGVGVTTPVDKLHVAGNVLIDGYKAFVARYTSNDNYRGHLSWDHLQLGNNGNNYIVAGNSSAGGSLGFVVNNTNDLTGLYADTNKNGTIAMQITNAGNIGIGTQSPSGKLDVRGGTVFISDSVAAPSAFIQGTASVAYFGAFDGRRASFGNQENWETLTVDGGNVGIGTTAPGAQLHVSGNGPALATGINTQNILASGSSGFIGYSLRRLDDANGGWLLGTSAATAGDFALYQNQGASAVPISRLHVSTTGNVGIGATNASAKLQVGSWNLIKDGTWAPPVTPPSDSAGERIVFYQGSGWKTAIGMDGQNGIWFQAHTPAGQPAYQWFTGVNAVAPTEKMRIMENGNVGIGTTNPTQKLAVNGTIRAKEIIVDTGWADYVFDESYRLAPLAEVEQHIKSNKHLPGIPSAQEIAEHGVSMGDMQSKLLSKIEELTLHMIKQEKLMTAQQGEIAALRQQVSELKAAANP